MQKVWHKVLKHLEFFVKSQEKLVHKTGLYSLEKVYKCKKCGIRFWSIICFEIMLESFKDNLFTKLVLNLCKKFYKCKMSGMRFWSIWNFFVKSQEQIYSLEKVYKWKKCGIKFWSSMCFEIMLESFIDNLYTRLVLIFCKKFCKCKKCDIRNIVLWKFFGKVSWAIC